MTEKLTNYSDNTVTTQSRSFTPVSSKVPLFIKGNSSSLVYSFNILQEGKLNPLDGFKTSS